MSTQNIQIRMREETKAQADRFKEKIHAPSRSDAIRRAIELSSSLVNAIARGDKIILEGKNGRRQVIIPGLDNE